MSALVLAESLLRAGNAAGAMKVLKESAGPGPERDLLLGRCALRAGDIATAIAAFSDVLAKNPRELAAAAALGSLYVQRGWFDKAEALYSRTLKKVDDERLRVDYALVLWKRGQPTLALQELGRVLARSPRLVAALLQRGFLLIALSRYDEAAADLRVLVEEAPARDEGWVLLGMAEFGRERYEAALPCLEEACRRLPADMNRLKTLAQTLIMCGRLDAATAALARLREHDPVRWQDIHNGTRASRVPGSEGEIDPRPVFLMSAHQEQKECNWEHRARFEAVYRDVIERPGSADPSRLSHNAGIVPLDTAARRRLAGLAATATGAGITPFPHAASPVPARLRVGYVLPHLGEHVVAKIMRGFVAAHDPAAVEVNVIAVRQLASDRASGMPERYAALPGVSVHDLSDLDDAGIAARLREMDFDVLVDLAVYNDGGRPGVLAHRPAPVQVSFLGAPFSSGAPWLDYIVTDAVVSPPEADWCTEAEVRLPASYFVYGHDDAEPPAPLPRAALGLPAEAFLYSALNNPYKIDPADFACWMRILAATPGSLLLFKDDRHVADHLRPQAERAGIDPARLVFLPRVAQEEYLRRQGVPDLFLDTRYYGAHTTMAESLWMGVPALSCRGAAFQNRVGASLLAACGLDELIMPDPAAYEATAIALFHDRARLQRLREHLAVARLTAAPFDMPGQARRMESAFRHMRERFARGLPPAGFTIDAAP